MKKKILIQFLIFLSVFSVSYLSYMKHFVFVESFENKLNDIMLFVRGNVKADSRIVIVDIDEKSLHELGQWPWSRNIVAKILYNLAKKNVGIIGLDIVFAEHDNSSPKRVFKKMGIPNKNVEDYDAILANAIGDTPTVVGYVFALQNDGVIAHEVPKSQVILIEKNKPKNSYLIKGQRAILNIPMIQEKAYSNGYFNTVPDKDGVVRSIPLVIEYKGFLYPSLSLEITRLVMAQNKMTINYLQDGVDSILMDSLHIPTDFFGRLKVNYRGTSHRYKYISASDVYYNRVKKNDLEGKIALVGTSSAGLLDLRSSPLESTFPGVEIHATAIDNILNQNFLFKPTWIYGVDLLSIFFLLLFVFIILMLPNALLSFIFFLGLNILLLLVDYYMMVYKGIILSTFIPLISLNFLFLIGSSVNFFLETKQKNRIKNKFASKVSSVVVDELMKNNTEEFFEGKEEEITIFFSDIRGFTSLSEDIGSAQKLINFLNEYITPMSDIILEHKGTIDKFIGDSIMAYWNAPINVKAHSDKALCAAIEQIKALAELNNTFALQDKPLIDIGIGLNTGLSIVGEIGSKGRSDYTCIGDSVNLASRVESLCKVYGVKIIITEFTKVLLEGKYELRELDIVKVKGKAKPVVLYECYGDKSYTWKKYNDALQYELAIKLYRNSEFEKAYNIFYILNQDYKQKLYELYLERCMYFKNNPPSNFNGVFTFEKK